MWHDVRVCSNQVAVRVEVHHLAIIACVSAIALIIKLIIIKLMIIRSCFVHKLIM